MKQFNPEYENLTSKKIYTTVYVQEEAVSDVRLPPPGTTVEY